MRNIALSLAASSIAFAANFPRVDADLKAFDDVVKEKKAAFAKIPAAPEDMEWIKRKLSHMVDVDQYMRKYSSTPFDHGYSEDEKQHFNAAFGPRAKAIDTEDAEALKIMLKKHKWFLISKFGEQADNNAWLLVQHADHDRPFQKQVLAVLTGLYEKGETKPVNYAYLFDRVARGDGKLQRYGTQGKCTGPSTWEPDPIEEPSLVDQRRKSVGLFTMAEYKELFKTGPFQCH